MRWVKGSRRGPFEFAHEELRSAILQDLNPLRRQAIHRGVAATLLADFGEKRTDPSELVVHHLLAGGDLDSVLPHLEAATARAAHLGAAKAVEAYLEKQARVLDHLIRNAGNETEKRKLQEKQQKLPTKPGS